MKPYLAIDIGGTQIKYGILSENAEFLEKGALGTPVKEGGPGILAAVTGLVKQSIGRRRIVGVCISSAGVVNCDRGEIVYAGETIPRYIGTNFKKTIEARFGLPCEVENDVNCAGLAEYTSGAGQKSHCMVCLTVGTGIGGCAILEGKVLHGASSSAMEIGYLQVEGDDFQKLGATKILGERVRKRKGEPKEHWDGRRIFAAAREGDGICRDAIAEMCDALGKGIASICYVLNPDTVVLGGGIMAQQDYLEPILKQSLQKHMRPMVYEPLHLRFAQYQNDAGMIGAFYHFIQRRQ